MAIVIVVTPIAIAMPPVAVLVPPAMVLIPAVFSSFVQIAPRMIGLPAVPAMMLHGFMQFVIRLGDLPQPPFVLVNGFPVEAHVRPDVSVRGFDRHSPPLKP